MAMVMMVVMAMMMAITMAKSDRFDRQPAKPRVETGDMADRETVVPMKHLTRRVIRESAW